MLVSGIKPLAIWISAYNISLTKSSNKVFTTQPSCLLAFKRFSTSNNASVGQKSKD